MITNATLSSRLQVTPAGNWVPVSEYRQFMGIGVMQDADANEGVTVQLRKATSAAGADAANHGDPVTTLADGADQDVTATAEAGAAELGLTAGDVPFTHVSALVSAAGSPAPTEGVYGVLIRSSGRYNP